MQPAVGIGGWTDRALGRLRGLLEIETANAPLADRRRLMCVNAAAHAATFVGTVLLLQYLTSDPWLYRWVVVVNLVMIAVSVSVPFLHRIGPNAGWMTLVMAADLDLFAVAALLGRDAGLHLLLLAAPAVMFVMMGLERLTLALTAILVSVALYLAAQWMFPEGMLDEAPPREFLFRIHAISAIGLTFIVASVLYYVLWLSRRAEARVESLMYRTFPEKIAQRLMDEPAVAIADACPQASVLFSDIEDFVALSHRLGAVRTVSMLNDLMTRFDRLAGECGVERIKTIGDAYMAASGVPQPAADHAARMARFALSMHHAAQRTGDAYGDRLRLRVGLAAGPVMAGVIGTRRFGYDIWGEAVNLAARLERRCQAGDVLVSEAFREQAGPGFAYRDDTIFEIKGLGARRAHVLVAEVPGSAGAGPDAILTD